MVDYQVVFARLRNDLGDYIVERGAFGRSVWAWYHRQFWEAARERYLPNKDKELRAHKFIADYFNNKLQEKFPDRGISHQPLYWKSSSGEVIFNSMKLSQLPTSIIYSSSTGEFENSVCNLEFVAAKCAAGLGRELIKDLSSALVKQTNVTVGHFSEFVASQMHILEKHPELTLQHALNTGDHSNVYMKATEVTNVTPWLANPPLMMRHINKAKGKDPCVFTMSGHLSQVTGIVLETIIPKSSQPYRYVT